MHTLNLNAFGCNIIHTYCFYSRSPFLLTEMYIALNNSQMLFFYSLLYAQTCVFFVRNTFNDIYIYI